MGTTEEPEAGVTNYSRGVRQVAKGVGKPRAGKDEHEMLAEQAGSLAVQGEETGARRRRKTIAM